ncbi:MAG TPA: phosphatidate cytidylyltransferase [Candidatus Binatia bacterium]|nr:phosphatidate cytidylyltransferase [Candidatus Binatia bacterium]
MRTVPTGRSAGPAGERSAAEAAGPSRRATPPATRAPAGRWSGLPVRVASGAVLLILAGGLLYVGGIPLDLLVGAVAAVAAWELWGLVAHPHGDHPGLALAPLWLLAGVAIWLAERPVLPGAGGDPALILGSAVLAGMVAGVLLRAPFAGWAAGLGGGLYLGVGLGSLLGLDHWPGAATGKGLGLLAVVIGAVIATDTLAYFCGMAAGRHRHPFFPRISPRKSVEGAVGGAAGAILVAGIAGPLALGLPAATATGMGLLIAIAAQGGDLAESALKRQAGVKDSGWLIPGHGGLLDRVDGLLLAGPAVYCLLVLIGFH